MSTTKKSKKAAAPVAAPSSPEPITATVEPAAVVAEPVLPAVTYRVEEAGKHKQFGTHTHTLVIDRKGKVIKHAMEGAPTEADIQRLVHGR